MAQSVVFAQNLKAHLEMMTQLSSLESDIHYMIKCMHMCFEAGGKILIAGNGGSASDAQHFASEFTGRFNAPNRQALAAIALTTDISAITSISNDFGFEFIFSRQLEALAKPQDIFIGITTSGNSPNIIRAVDYAHQQKIQSFVLSGKSGGKLNALLCEKNIVVPSQETARIQEAHIFIIHYICQYFDELYALETVENLESK